MILMQNLIRLTRDLQFGPLQMSQNTRISPGTNFSKISREFFFDFFVIKIIIGALLCKKYNTI